MYAQSVQSSKDADSDVYKPNGPKPVFLKTDSVKNSEKKPLTGEELYVALVKTVPIEHICGIQEIRSLWRIYLSSQDERIKVISSGIDLRGSFTPVYDTNPFTRSHQEHVIRVTVKDVPLSVSDNLIRMEIEATKTEIKGDIVRQRLRVNGQLTNCLNGDRALYISPPSQPLPRKMVIGGIFRARVYHNGQQSPNTGVTTCSRCLEKGHHVTQCNNNVKCQECRKDGHVKNQCPERNLRENDGAIAADDVTTTMPRDAPGDTNRVGRDVHSNEGAQQHLMSHRSLLQKTAIAKDATSPATSHVTT